MYYGYDAVFFKTEDVEKALKELNVGKNALSQSPDNYHMTVKYHGKQEPSDETKTFMEKYHGTDIHCNIIGYGNDGKNEGLLLEGYQKNGTPCHITLSYSDESKAVNTGKMHFNLFEKPITITGKLYNSRDPELKDPEYSMDLVQDRER